MTMGEGTRPRALPLVRKTALRALRVAPNTTGRETAATLQEGSKRASAQRYALVPRPLPLYEPRESWFSVEYLWKSWTLGTAGGGSATRSEGRRNDSPVHLLPVCLCL